MNVDRITQHHSMSLDSPDSETRSCEECRYFVATTTPIGNAFQPVGQCRRHPPMPDFRSEADGTSMWPQVAGSDWCGQFMSTLKKFGPKKKVPDSAIIESVWDRQKPLLGPDGTPLRKEATLRSTLVRELRDRGLTETPALKRIQKLVQQGVLLQGDNPWRQEGDSPGIYVWLNERHNAAQVSRVFLEELRLIVPSAKKALSMRAIHRELAKTKAVSLGTVSKRMGALVAAGLVLETPDGYYVSPVATTAGEVGT